MQHFAETLQFNRKQLGLSQERLAEHIGVTRQSVAKWELGDCLPEIDKLIALADLFRTSLDALVRDPGTDACTAAQSRVGAGVRTPPITEQARLAAFLCRAKIACYAGGKAENPASRPLSHDLHYAEGELAYIDSYLGGERFAGEEAVWQDGVPRWSMNYVGRCLSPNFSGDFLKECLALVSPDLPFRGPAVHDAGDYRYHCVVRGGFEWFEGQEEIFCRRERVYECLFHGGLVVSAE